MCRNVCRNELYTVYHQWLCFLIDQHPSKPLISLVPITCTTYCFQGYGHCYANHHPFCFPSKSQTLFGIGAGPPMFLESIGSHLTLFKCNWMLEIYFNVMNNTCMNVIIIAKPDTRVQTLNYLFYRTST